MTLTNYGAKAATRWKRRFDAREPFTLHAADGEIVGHFAITHIHTWLDADIDCTTEVQFRQIELVSSWLTSGPVIVDHDPGDEG